MKLKLNLFRFFLILLGSFMAGCGIAAAIQMGMGGASLSVMWEAIHIHTGMTIGMASFLLSMGMAVVLLRFDRKQLHCGTILHLAIYSFSIDLFNHIQLQITGAAPRILCMLLAIVIFGIGLGIYSAADLGRGPYDGICFSISCHKHWQLKYVREALDGVFILSGWLFGGTVGLCTIFCMIFTGPLLQSTKGCVQKMEEHMFLSGKVPKMSY